MSTIEFHELREDDIPDLVALAQYFQGKFLADDEFIDENEFTLERQQAKFTLVFTAPSQEGKLPVGAVDFSDINGDLSAILHFIMRPAYLKVFLKEKTYLDALLDRFRTVNVRKFTLVVPDFNHSAQKLATRMGFQFVATFKNEVYFEGKPRDIHFYELTRKDLAKALAKQLIEEEQEPECQDVVIPKVMKLPRKRKARVKQ